VAARLERPEGRFDYVLVESTEIFARWLSWRQPSLSNVSHRRVSASREPSGPSSSAQGCF
jgi:hypothetical protein